jgi:hypothetical protein
MRTVSVNVTDLSSYDSPSIAIRLDEAKFASFVAATARDLIEAMPELALQGMCVALYDENGTPISIVPLDPIQ